MRKERIGYGEDKRERKNEERDILSGVYYRYNQIIGVGICIT